MSWTQQRAIALCMALEAVTPEYGAHVALTGGCLYKIKPGLRTPQHRKDCDVLFYRIRQRKCIDMDGMWEALVKIGFVKLSGFGWCYKAIYDGDPVDCFFPEMERDAYGNEIEYGNAPPAAQQNEFDALLPEPPDEDILF